MPIISADNNTALAAVIFALAWLGFWIDGKPMPIVPAYVGLKAVWVPQGESVVRMKFSAWSNVGVRVLALGGAICSLSLLLFCGISCIRGFPSSRRKVTATPPNSSAVRAT